MHQLTQTFIPTTSAAAAWRHPGAWEHPSERDFPTDFEYLLSLQHLQTQTAERLAASPANDNMEEDALQLAAIAATAAALKQRVLSAGERDNGISPPVVMNLRNRIREARRNQRGA